MGPFLILPPSTELLIVRDHLDGKIGERMLTTSVA